MLEMHKSFQGGLSAAPTLCLKTVGNVPIVLGFFGVFFFPSVFVCFDSGGCVMDEACGLRFKNSCFFDQRSSLKMCLFFSPRLCFLREEVAVASSRVTLSESSGFSK